MLVASEIIKASLFGFDLVHRKAQELGRGGDGHRVVHVHEGAGQTESRRTCFGGDSDGSVGRFMKDKRYLQVLIAINLSLLDERRMVPRSS